MVHAFGDLSRQSSGSGANLDGRRDVGELFQNLGMDALSGNESLVQFGLFPIEDVPREVGPDLIPCSLVPTERRLSEVAERREIAFSFGLVEKV
jgi:hypothetical protein